MLSQIEKKIFYYNDYATNCGIFFSLSVPGMALILLVKVQSRVLTTKCSEPQAVRRVILGEGRGVAKSLSLRIET